MHQLFPLFLANLVQDKENKVKDMTDMMGLKSEIYWIVTYIFDYALYFVVMMFLIIAGAIFQVIFVAGSFDITSSAFSPSTHLEVISSCLLSGVMFLLLNLSWYPLCLAPERFL